ncbi:MAG TPA: amidohydrolase [Candidatus Sulfotelmatobacter sp.]|nr:amidohydrolase [Candidatus Sulfotelmatobacter sp.]
MATLTHSAIDLNELVAVRRDLHMHPETAFEEVRTSGIVTEKLKVLGLTPRTGIGKTGVMATIQGGRPGKTVMLRADMDALPIHEENDVPYRSQTPGKMHACGHDCHTSILLAVAKQLVHDAPQLPGKVVLCFQPAEEWGGGAEAMIRDGALDYAKPDATFGMHVWQDLPVGTIGVTSGPFMAAVDEFAITVHGKGAHGAMPHLSSDPIVALAHIVTALQTIASRNTDPFREIVVSVTQLRAGTAFNIIPQNAWMNGTIRSFDPDVWKEIPGRVERIVKGVAEGMGCRAELKLDRMNRPTVNDSAMAELARGVAIEMVGADHVRSNVRTMGGEDFSAFLARVPGCFIAVGSRNESKGLVWDHHHPRFDVDEQVLALGAEMMLRTTRKFLGA